MKLTVEQALTYAHSQILELLDNHVPSDVEDMPSLKEQLFFMAVELQNAAESSDLTQDH